MIQKILLRIVFFLTLSVSFVFASGDSSFDGCFPHQGYGASPIALGSAYTAISNDILSLYWNPAGLAEIKSRQLITQQYDLGGLGITHSVLSFGAGQKGRGWAVSWNRLEPTNTWGYSYQEDTFAFGTGKKINSLQLGLSAKGYHSYLKSAEETDRKWSLGLDLGLIFNHNASRFGIATRDLISLPAPGVAREYSLGYAWIGSSQVLALGIDFQGQARTLKLGFEYQLLDGIAIRCGLRGTDLTAGVGFTFQNINIDYAFSNNSMGKSNIFTYQLSF
jgi:hypothetical protein